MARSRLVDATAATVGALAVLALLPGVVAADTVTGELIRGLNRRLLYMAVPIGVLVEVILVYAVLRFRTNDEPTPTRENRQLEITWTVATGLVLLFVGTASFAVLGSPLVGAVPTAGAAVGGGATVNGTGPATAAPGTADGDVVEVVGVAQQWEWEFRYPDEGVTSDELVLPRGRAVVIYVTSTDVIHSLHVPDLGLKQDAFPGQYNRLRTQATDAGTATLYCAEFCGQNHANMTATVRVVTTDQFDRWLASNGTADPTARSASAPGAES